MSWLEQHRALALYNQQMNRKLYRLAATLTETERRRHRGAFFGSIHGTFNHLLLADRIWMLRLTGDESRYAVRDEHGQPVSIQSMGQELYAKHDRLSLERERTDTDIIAYVQQLTEPALTENFQYRRGQSTVKHARWWALAHLFNHQTHHRGQVTTLLSQASLDPGVTDLIAQLRDPEEFSRA